VNQQDLETEIEYGKELVMRLEVTMKSAETLKSFVISSLQSELAKDTRS
jgi:hypothetical protein